MFLSSMHTVLSLTLCRWEGLARSP